MTHGPTRLSRPLHSRAVQRVLASRTPILACVAGAAIAAVGVGGLPALATASAPKAATAPAVVATAAPSEKSTTAAAAHAVHRPTATTAPLPIADPAPTAVPAPPPGPAPTTGAAPSSGSAPTASPTASPAPSTLTQAVATAPAPTTAFLAAPATAPAGSPDSTAAASPTPGADPSIDTTGTRFPTGAAAIGSTSYAVPAGALVVAPNGSDSAAGTPAAPFATVQRAINAALSGATIVLRQGSYHESLTVPSGKKLTIQSFPGEAVYLDGSSRVSNWTQSGSVWKATGWNHVFDASPTFTRGAPDGTTAGWQWVNPAYPMAAHPDQLWVGGIAMKQVADASLVTAGTFFYDTAAQTLVLGTNPSGKEVRASDLQKAITVGSAGFTLRGIGVRRYAPSVPDMGAVTDYQGGATFENVSFTDNATTGVSLGGAGDTLRRVTVARNGLLGIQTNYSDNLTLDGVLASGNNAEHFNTSPVSGGVKITRSRTVTVENSAFVNNFSHGLWFDESVYGMTIAHNDSLGNGGNGIVLEISASATIVDNVVSRNASDGLKLDDIGGGVQVWNNTLTDNTKRNLDITQDARRGNNASDAGHDPRQVFPDPTMTWITGPDTIRNNIISGGSGNCLLCVEDYSHTYSAAQLGIDADYNLYRRPSPSAPTWFAVWSRGVGDPAVYNTLYAFTSATGKDAHSTLVESAPALTTAQLNASASGSAAALPAAIASIAGRPTGTVHLGAW